MPNRLLYTVKLTSGLLKEYKYNIDTFDFWAKKHSKDYDGTPAEEITDKRKKMIRFNECL